MKKNQVLSFVGIGLCAASAILFGVLYFTPYHIKNVEQYLSITKPTTELNLVTNDALSLSSPESINDFSSKVDYNLLEKSSYSEFVSKTSLKSDRYDDHFFAQSNLLLLSFKGKIMRYSKVTKLSVKKTEIKVFFSTENDFILNGTAKPSDDTYTYYLVPVNAKYQIKDMQSLSIIVKTV